MFNVTILKLKDIKKYLIGMTITAILVIIATNYLPKISEKTNTVKKSISNSSMVECLTQAVPTIASIKEDTRQNIEIKKIEEKNILQSILKTQISSIKGIEQSETEEMKNQELIAEQAENSSKTNEEEHKNEKDENNADTKVEAAKTGISTQVITNNPIRESYNAQYHNVKIKNQTEYNLTEEMLTPDITIENKNIVIFHTHTCESYTASETYPYTPTGNFRTTDLNYTVARVGTELENHLKQYQLNVIHDMSYHDYPSYNGSYANSLATVENILKTTPSDIIIDLHRDAIGSRSDYAPIVKIGEEDIAAQVMFVIRN